MTSPSLLSQPVPATPAQPQSATQRIGIPITLFCVTLISTTAVGMRYMYNFRAGAAPFRSDADVLPYGWVLHNLRDLSQGLPFSLTLIAILLAHEFGHYFACRAFNVRSTLPWLLPAPSLSGTFGAVIRLKSRVRSRAALIVIGASGPIAGFVVAIAATFVGLALSRYAPTQIVHAQSPLLMTAIHGILRHMPGADLPRLSTIIPHPVLTASWIGLLITALNLIPAGQLDGGHIIYAVSPAAHRYTATTSVIVLFVLGVVYWAPWILWAMLLMLPGMRHPAVRDASPIQRRHLLLLPVCLLILVLAATYQPFHGYSLWDVAHKLPHRYHRVSQTQ